LPNFLGFWTPDELPAPTPLPALERGYVTFGSFNRLDKVGPLVLSYWAKLLTALPTARLLLKAPALADPWQQGRIRELLEREGVAAERVTLLGLSSRAAHFAAYGEIDLALDPFPHGGAMTTMEALWMGVPVVTWTGSIISSRLAAATLTAIGLQ